MKKEILVITFLAIGINSYCQKFYITPNAGAQLAELSYLKSKIKPADLRVPRPTFVPTVGIGLYLNSGSFTHRLGLQYLAAGMNFKVQTRNYWKYGGGSFISGTSIDHYLISYTLQKESLKQKHFIGNTKLKWKYALGIGFGTNESKFHFDFYSAPATGYSQFQTGDFYGYEYTQKREGFGLFLMPEAGFDLFNKKGKRFLSIDFFYYKGLKNMISYDLHYYYGNLVNNTRKDENIVLGTRGTVFGVKVGVPIRIIN